MSKDKDSATKPPVEGKKPWWPFGRKPKGDRAKSSGTSPPVAAAAATAPLGAPPEVDLSGFQFDGDPPIEKPKPSGLKIGKRRSAMSALGTRHYPTLLGILFYTEDFADMPAMVDEYFGTVKGLPDAERRALWIFVVGALGRHAATKFAAPKGADDAARKTARQAIEVALGKFIDAYCEVDPINSPSPEDLKRDLAAFEAAFYGAIGFQFMHEVLKEVDEQGNPKSLRKPATADSDDTGLGMLVTDAPGPNLGPKPRTRPGTAIHADDSDAPLPMPTDDPPRRPKAETADGTPIHADFQDTLPPTAAAGGGLGQGSLLKAAGIDADTIPLVVEEDDNGASHGTGKKKK